MVFRAGLKLAAIGFIALLLVIPLMRIGGLVRERQAARDQAVEEIARGAGLAQTITGPVLVVPATRTVRSWVQDAASGQRRQQESRTQVFYYFLPERLAFDGRLATSVRNRGLYEARLYRATNRIAGHFQLPVELEAPREDVTVLPGRPFRALGIADVRGIAPGLALRVDGQPVALHSGSSVEFLGGGVHAPLDLPSPAPSTLRFEIDLTLQGTSRFAVVPAGRESIVRMASDWPHPGFTGDLLPVTRAVSDAGFSAEWQTSFFATNLQEIVQRCGLGKACALAEGPQVGVSFLDPVDRYVRTDRAIKYGLLFIVLTFAAIVLCEVLRRAEVHPVQYGLTGLALAIFFLLLLSLSEHLGFALAYALSAAASVALIGYYLAHVLGGAARGAVAAGGLAVLHGLLYAILGSEDYALLLGAVLLFTVLGAFMVLTRKVDWSFRPAPSLPRGTNG